MQDQIKDFLGKQKWTFAKTMPQIPHEYIVREAIKDDAAFVLTVMYIREFGYAKKFGKREFTYLDLDGYSYWTMGSPIEITRIINRARIK